MSWQHLKLQVDFLRGVETTGNPSHIFYIGSLFSQLVALWHKFKRKVFSITYTDVLQFNVPVNFANVACGNISP